MGKNRSSNNNHHRITKAELSGFDQFMTDIILRAGELGWIGRVGTRGHALLYAPVGKDTLAIPREHLRNRSGHNAKAALDRWVRQQEELLALGTKYAIPTQEIVIEQVETLDIVEVVENHNVTCPECSRGFKNKRALIAHQASHNRKAKTLKMTAATTETPEPGAEAAVEDPRWDFASDDIIEFPKVAPAVDVDEALKAVQALINDVETTRIENAEQSAILQGLRQEVHDKDETIKRLTEINTTLNNQLDAIRQTLAT